jgi:hypothetical protein
MAKVGSRLISFIGATLLLSACAAFSFEQAQPTAEFTLPSPYGSMFAYQTPSSRFEVLLPADWNDAAGDDRRCRDAQKCLISRDNEFILLREVRMPATDGTPLSLTKAIDNVVANFELTTADAEFISREPVSLEGGLPAEVLRYRIENGTVSVKELWAADGDLALSVAFITWNEGYSGLEPLADYIIENIRLTGDMP